VTETRETRWKDKVREHHLEEVADGLHDGDCEWRQEGHFLCHCSMRRRIASGFTTPPGELIFRGPLCPRCDNEVGHDGDGYICETCAVQWPTSYGGQGSFYDDYGHLDRHLRIDAARDAAAAAAQS
jgi:hypothetical protein